MINHLGRNLIDTLRAGASFVEENDLATVVRAFNARETHPFLQFIKYGICGVAAVVVHMAIFYLLATTSFLPALDSSTVAGELVSDGVRARNSAINNLVAWIFANLTAYFLNVIWVFQPGRHHKWVEFGLFSLVAFVAFLGGLIGGPLLIKLFGINTHLSQLLFVVTSACVNYLCRKFFIFNG